MSTKLSRICNGILETAWLSVVIVTPLFFNVYSSRIFEPDKIALLRTLVLIMLGVWIVKLIDQGVKWEKLEWKDSFIKSISQIPMVLPALALAGIYIVATIFSVSPRVSFFGSYQRLQGTYTTISYLLLFAVLLGNIRKREQVERLITTIILASLPVSIYGILQKNMLDPVPWGGDVSERIAANMGNSIFVAAYLIMVVILSIGRVIQSLSSILKETGRLWSQVLRATLYIIIMVLDLVAIIMSGSRGPFLGLFVGIILLVLLLTIYWRVRWATWLMVGGALLAGFFLVLLNIPNGPLESLRNTEWVGRFGHVFDTQQRTSQVRILIWQGASELVAPHTPLVKPNGEQDAFNFLRPLIGYGPEGMYVAYNQYYPPELGGVEKRNASPDRSHNETWDAIVMTGIIGLGAYLWIFGSLSYYSLKWLGLIRSRKQTILYWLFIFVGGIFGVIGLGIWQGWEFIGIGLPFGIVFGLISYVGYQSLFVKYSSEVEQSKNPAQILIMALLAAVVAHFIEINFGIAIAVTRTYFWVFTALIVLLGFVLPKYDLVEGKLTSEPSPVKKTRGKQVHQPLNGQTGWFYSALLSGFTIGLILTTLGYDFIMNIKRSASIGQILATSFTRLPNQDHATAYGVLLLVITSWIVGVFISNTENPGTSKIGEWWKSFGVIAGLSACIGILFYILQAASLARIAQFVASNQDGLLKQANNIGGLLNLYYLYILFLIISISWGLSIVWSTKGKGTNVGWLVAPVALIVIWALTSFLNLRVIHADMVYKMADPFKQSGQWPIATLLFKNAIQLVPNEDHYYISLAQSYLEQAKGLSSTEEQDKLILKAEDDLKKAQRINPLNTDHTANLGRLFSWWAGQASDQQERIRRGLLSSNYYSEAVKLSPNNPTIWGEWAFVFLDILGDQTTALEKLNYAIELDDRYNYTQGLMGDFYMRLSRATENEAEKKIALDTAAEYYRQAIELSTGKDAATKPKYLISLGNTFLDLANQDPELIDTHYLEKAIVAFTDALNAGINTADVWKIEETLAKLYAQIGDRSSALAHAELALRSAPEAQKQQIISLIDQLNLVP